MNLKKCPICEANWAIWNQAKEIKNEALAEKARSRQAQISYIANVLVVQDLTRPEFNGQVKLWEHTRRINGWLIEPMQPPKDVKEEERGFEEVEEKRAHTNLQDNPISKVWNTPAC